MSFWQCIVYGSNNDDINAALSSEGYKYKRPQDASHLNYLPIHLSFNIPNAKEPLYIMKAEV